MRYAVDAYYNRFIAKQDSLIIDLIASLGFEIDTSANSSEFYRKLNSLRKIIDSGGWNRRFSRD